MAAAKHQPRSRELSEEEVDAEIAKKYGGIIVRGDELRSVHRLTSGSLAFDLMLGGGWPLNLWNEIIGDPSCLAPETHIPYQVVRDGKVINSKGGTIERLWRRLHDEPHHNASRCVVGYRLASVDEDDRIVVNEIMDVVHTGRQECFNVLTTAGHSIVATANHRFYTGLGFVRLKDMQPGQTVYVHDGSGGGRHKPNEKRKYVHVKHHAVAGVHFVRDVQRGYEYAYHRLQLARAVMEAHLSGLSLERYLDRLNTGDLAGLVMLPRDMHVHHIDEDFTNNDLSNLSVITASDHGRLHAAERKMGFVAHPDTVVSVTPVGERLTYDIKMAAPFHNYVANRFVVHNSGKTSTIYKTIASAQAANPDFKVLWVASEPYAHAWATAAGVDNRRVKIVETNVMEEAFETVIRYAENRLRDCIVIDSLPALVPSDENEHLMEEWQMGLGARLTGKFFRKQGTATRRDLVEVDRDMLLLVVNQWREKIGITYGDPRYTPGGRAKDYWFAIRVEEKRDEWIEHNKRRVGITIKAHTIKNKTAPPQRTAAVDFYFDEYSGFPAGSFDGAKDLLACGLWTEVMEKGAGGSKGNKFTFLGETWYGEPAMLQALREDVDLQNSLRREVLRAQGVEVVEAEQPKSKTTRAPSKAKVVPVKSAPKRVLRRK